MAQGPLNGWFITGTDTGVGKTWASLAIMHRLKQSGLSVAGMKPVASGAEATPEGLRNEDALLLQGNASVTLPYQLVNPYCFLPPVSPHIAARTTGDIDFSVILHAFQELSRRVDRVVVEGVGGWYAPLSERHTVASLALVLALPVVLVVGMRLGCLNHALLSAQAIQDSGLLLKGWVASPIDVTMDAYADNLATLTDRLDAPCLGELPHLKEPQPALLAQGLAGAESWSTQ